MLLRVFQAPFVTGDAIDEKLYKDFFKKARYRIRGGFNYDKHKQLIIEIRDDISQLCNFTKGVVEMEDSKHEKIPTVISSYWLNIRAHADGLYSALSSIWSQSCTSHPHQAKIRLNLLNSDRNDYDTTKLNMAFLMESKSTLPRSLPREWRDVTVLSLQKLHPE
jgi:hypothetical protein